MNSINDPDGIRQHINGATKKSPIMTETLGPIPYLSFLLYRFAYFSSCRYYLLSLFFCFGFLVSLLLVAAALVVVLYAADVGSLGACRYCLVVPRFLYIELIALRN